MLRSLGQKPDMAREHRNKDKSAHNHITISSAGPTCVSGGGGRVVRWCWVNFSAGASYNLDTVGQGPLALAVGAGWGCLYILLSYILSLHSLWETARYRLKYFSKGR